MLLEQGDIEIADLNEAHRQCPAVVGGRTLPLRVIEADPGRSRLSMLAGGGKDDVDSQALANGLLEAICDRLEAPCEWGVPPR